MPYDISNLINSLVLGLHGSLLGSRQLSVLFTILIAWEPDHIHRAKVLSLPRDLIPPIFADVGSSENRQLQVVILSFSGVSVVAWGDVLLDVVLWTRSGQSHQLTSLVDR